MRVTLDVMTLLSIYLPFPLTLQFQHIDLVAKAETLFLMLNSETGEILYRMQSPHLVLPQSTRFPDLPQTFFPNSSLTQSENVTTEHFKKIQQLFYT